MGSCDVVKQKRLALVLPFLLMALWGCPEQNPDINRVTGTYYDKSFFNSKWQSALLSPDEWYYRLTITDTPTNTEAAAIGGGHWLHPETIRFEVTEKFLIGWRAQAGVPGSENDQKEGVAGKYRGEPVAVFRINDHFDIAREYDPVTTERSNVISENRDRPWEKRRYMRVDFSRNVVHEIKREDAYPWIWGSESLETDNAYVIGQSDPANPKRIRLEDGYFEVTSRQGIKPDFIGFVGGYGPAYRYDNASPVVDTRISILKKSAEDDYEPLGYPDQVFLVDDNGKEIRDRKGFSKTERIWERFGFFRASFSGQQTWDPKRGSLESNKNYNIARFNIWKQTYRTETGSDGAKIKTLIPVMEREPKPIVYYTNVEHPSSLMAASRRVAAEWDLAFRELVFHAQQGKYASVNDVPQMWILKENDCNVANVSAWLEKIEASTKKTIETQAGFTVSDVANRINLANDKGNPSSFTERHNAEAQARADLERICSALEFHTVSRTDGFKYQRSGDMRHNMMNLITKQAQTPWSGYGPMFADQESGRIIQAQANVNLWYIDRRAAWASRQIDAMNGKIDLNDLLYGNDIKKIMAEKMVELNELTSKTPSDEALQKMDQRFYDLDRAGELLVEIAPKQAQTRMAALGVKLERKLIEGEHDDKQSADQFMYLGAHNHGDLANYTGLSNEILNRISPARGQDLAARLMQKKEQTAAQKAMYPADPIEIIDPLVVGLAIRYKDLPARERFEKIREAVYTATMLHEVGHNMGLAHNMAGSSDALNYGSQFWDLQALPSNLDQAIAQTSDESKRKSLESCKLSSANFPVTTQECLGQNELMYSSIMDYHAAWNSDLGGLGPYDKAAIKFGYAQLVETFPKETMRIDPDKQDLSKWLFLNDWKKIPTELVNGTQAIGNRTHEKYEWQKATAKKVFPASAVPYRYCADSSGSYGPTCKAFDFGPDMRSQAKWMEVTYWQHYFFTHFGHDRMLTYDWDFENVVSRDLQVMSDYTDIMRWYYFLRATDPDFAGSDAEKDYLGATVMGLNHFAHVLGHPAPGQHASVPGFLSETVVQAKADDNRLAPTQLLMPWATLDNCVQANVAQLTQRIPVAPKPGYVLANIKLGDGRPFYMGLTPDYEDWYITFVGSFFSKLYAGFFLSYPSTWFPRTDRTTDPRVFAINWYRLFPKEVGKLFHDMITENWTELGPVVDSKGKFAHRDLLDPVTMQAPDYTGYATVMPGVSSFLPYRAMFYASALLSGNKMPELDPIKTMQINLIGGIDDLRTTASPEETALFKHPLTGNTYRAHKVGEQPIAYNLVKKLNITKERYERLNRCVEDENARATDSFCQCVKTVVEKGAGNFVCCQSTNAACPQIGLSKVGEGTCSMVDLRIRRDQAREDMEQEVGFLDDMRWFYETYANIP